MAKHKNKSKRKRRENLWINEDGKCYWCGRETFLPPKGDPKALPSPDWATVDHIRTRLDKNRRDQNIENAPRTVLACWECNNLRGRLHQLAIQEYIFLVDVAKVKKI